MTASIANRYRKPLALALAWLSFAGSALAQSDESALDIVAAAVREHGYACQSPKKVDPDPDKTSPEEKAWIIQCENTAYRVKFLGDTGAEVTPLAD